MKKDFDLHDYSDIMEMPYPAFSGRRRMSNIERGAQFSPFAALTGYDQIIEETARLTDPQRQLSEEEREVIDRQLQLLSEPDNREQIVAMTYFVPDARKEGGAYVRCVGEIKRIEEAERRVLMQDGTEIPIDRIIAIECAIWNVIRD